ncbi:helix-turn-helix transcriptional regulator [Rubritalea spongiae]|uniref:Helix-turn-helix transcriptional regulator n=1 Tax=Rubritalea spongiae TaxID=430797 RepID=A0ABW5E2A5_9BACT
MTYDHIVSKMPANRISELLKRAPIDAESPEKLSELTGISLENIKLIEAGKLEPTLNMAYKLSAAFRIPLENLYADEQKVSTSFSSEKKGC